jgi:hypothetical protein
MSALIDGASWTAVCVKAVPGSAGPGSGLAITGTEDPMGRITTGRVVDMSLAAGGPGTYQINSGFVSIDGTSYPFGVGLGTVGSTTITTFAASGTGTNIVGSFTFATGSSGKSVTNGSFNIVF